MPSLINPFLAPGSGIPALCDWDGQAYEDFNAGTAPVTALVSFRLNTDGTFEVRHHGGLPLQLGSWFEPTTADVGDGYEARLTAPAGTFGGTVTNPFDDWTAITDDLLATFQTTFVGLGGGEKESTFSATCEIRPTGGSVVLTGDFTVLCNASDV
jgi:hypothetical protein